MVVMAAHKVGNTENLSAKIIRIVHISDTHMEHNELIPLIPDGDIIIHSGDFSQFSVCRYLGSRIRDKEETIHNLNSFFDKLPHKHKIFVAGNHELSFTVQDTDYITRELTSAVYLQDRSLTLEGINIYGTPWTLRRWYSFARGFSKKKGDFERHWDKIPENTDILVTHMPPLGIKDLGRKIFSSCKNLFSYSEGLCNICGEMHDNLEHWGCRELKRAILKRIRPKVHMFGHVHEQTGVATVDGIAFSNASMKLNKTVSVFDYYL